MRSLSRRFAAFSALVVLLHPLFFIIYRMSVFATVPRDDYAGYLLWLLGKAEGRFPDSPYAYRFLSMVAAAPFYVLPVIPLTNTPAGLSPEYLKATAALSMVAYLAWIGTATLSYATALRAGLGRLEAVLAGALVFALTAYVQVTAIDPLALLLVAACVLCLDRPGWLAGLLAVSVAVNEKVALVLAIWLGLRCLTARTDRTRLGLPFLLSAGAVALYGAAVALLRLPGNGYQQDVWHYPATVAGNLLAYGGARGLLLNVLPLAVLLTVALLARPVAPFARRDALLVPALAAVALVLTQFYQAGRIAMHGAPILVVPAAAFLGRFLARGEAPACRAKERRADKCQQS